MTLAEKLRRLKQGGYSIEMQKHLNLWAELKLMGYQTSADNQLEYLEEQADKELSKP